MDRRRFLKLADVAGFYAAFELTPATARPDMEDHIAAELEFMSVLALKEAYAGAEELPGGLTVTRDAKEARR
jgi:TorA maturation chaperone TorD